MTLAYARLRVSTSYNVSYPSTVAFDEIEVDTGDLTDPGDPTVVTITAGMTVIEVNVSLKGTEGSPTNLFVAILKNGVIVRHLNFYGRGASAVTNFEAPDNATFGSLIPVAEGDKIAAYVNCSSATTVPAQILQDSFMEVVDRTNFNGVIAKRGNDLTGITWPLTPLIYNGVILDTDDWYDPDTGLITVPAGFNAAGFTGVTISAGMATTSAQSTGTNTIRVQKQNPDTSWSDVRGIRPHMRNRTATGFSTNTAFVHAPGIPATDGEVFRIYANQDGLSATETVLANSYTMLSVMAVGAEADPVSFNDPYWPEVALLADFDGTGGAQTYVEKSSNRATMTGLTIAQLNGSVALFGPTGLSIGASSWARFPALAEYLFGSADFTIEFFVSRTASYPATPSYAIALYDTGANQRSWAIRIGSASIDFWYATVGSTGIQVIGAAAPGANTWHHVCVCRKGTDLRMFLDGVMIHKETGFTATFHASTAAYLSLGCATTNGSRLSTSALDNIRMEELRITRRARYDSDAGFVVPASAYPIG